MPEAPEAQAPSNPELTNPDPIIASYYVIWINSRADSLVCQSCDNIKEVAELLLNKLNVEELANVEVIRGERLELGTRKITAITIDGRMFEQRKEVKSIIEARKTEE